MAFYNVRLGQGTELDVFPPADHKPADHPVRLLRFVNNDLVIGTVIQANNERNFAVMTFPMFVDVYHCDEHDEEEEYELTPYLRNMIQFDIQHARPVVFNLDHCINALEPSPHLVMNYYRMLSFYKDVSDELLGRVKKETMH